MNPLFVSPVEDGTSFERAAVHVDSADREQKRQRDERAFSDEPRGMSQPDFTRLPFFLLPTLPLTFSPCIVGSYSPTLLSSAPGMPSHLFLLLNPPSYRHPSSLYLYLCLFLLSLPGDLCQVELCVCVCVCV